MAETPVRRPWDAVVEALQVEGVRHVFGLGGGDFYDALAEVPAIRPVLVRIQTSGVFMAMAVARLTGRPGVCFAPPGPGVANLVPGLLEAHSACTPLVVLAGASSTVNAGAGTFQEVDQMRLVEAVTKARFRITRPERTSWTMRRAFALALNGRPGPVYVEIPVDLGGVRAPIPPYAPSPHPLRSTPDPDDVERAAVLLARAERPVLVVGGGAVASRAFSEVRALAERLAMPVLTTPCGRGILPEDHPLALGLTGLYLTEPGEQTYGEADLVLGLGSRNEDFQSGRQTYFPAGARYIQVDIDPDEIGRNWIPDVAMVGDVALTIRALLAALPEEPAARARREARAREVQGRARAYEARVAEECRTVAVPLRSKRIVRELAEVFGRGTTLVNENGSQDLWSYSWPYYRVLDVNACVTPGEQTCMGFGVAAAIGARLAQPDRYVVCVTGDGAFQMFAKELPTAVEQRAPVLWVVLNNRALGWTRFNQQRTTGRVIASEFAVQPDFAELARLSGCRGDRVEHPDAIRPAVQRARSWLEEGHPVVLDFVVDGDEYPPGFVRWYQRNL
ncbi:MAG: thiamine pyrophosphate-binding protein [Armatimonadota bacterium]|nr:thiamine pyrophosphate-binding protein [Armatimonadota bacterium]MDR7487179.1 thiamine pyrophosphate-binding protein [Armatimonadota bacterium]